MPLFTIREAYESLNQFEPEDTFLSVNTLGLVTQLNAAALNGDENLVRGLAYALEQVCDGLNDDKEAAEARLAIAMAFYGIELPEEAANAMRCAVIAYRPYSHQYAITQWMYGSLLFQLARYRSAMFAWETSREGFSKLANKIDLPEEQVNWYIEINERISRSIDHYISQLKPIVLSEDEHISEREPRIGVADGGLPPSGPNLSRHVGDIKTSQDWALSNDWMMNLNVINQFRIDRSLNPMMDVPAFTETTRQDLPIDEISTFDISSDQAQTSIEGREARGKLLASVIRLNLLPVSDDVNIRTGPPELVKSIPISGEVNLEQVKIGDTIYTVYSPRRERSISLPSGHQYRVFPVKGDSMNLAGIREGDYVLVRTDVSPENNDMVAVYLTEEGLTLKRYKDEGGGTILLKPESSNPEHQVIETTQDKILNYGTVIAVFKPSEDDSQ